MITIIFLFKSTLLFANEVVHCEHNLQSILISDLITQVDKINDFNAKSSAEKIIFALCEHEVKKGNKKIRLRDNKILFTEYSDQYDSAVTNYYCKNKLGHSAYLNQVANILKHKIEEKFPPPPPKKLKRRVIEIETYVSVKAPMWDCFPPNYIKTRRRVNLNQKNSIVQTYGNVCVPVN